MNEIHDETPPQYYETSSASNVWNCENV